MSAAVVDRWLEDGGRLPPTFGPLVGRDEEIASTLTLLRQWRLVTLTGPGGVGKTRLAIEVARAATRDRSADGAWLADLVALRDPALVGHAVLDAFGLRDEAGAGVVAVLAERLEGRRVLLVVDNCEHLLDAVAELLSELLAALRGLTVLATSRERLRVTGEHVVHVSGLGESAAELFSACAAQAAPGFATTEANRETVIAIVDRLDGLPLAIELAAARLRVLSLAELGSRLNDRYRLLTGTRRLVTPRHRAMRLCVEWSYEQCSPAERVMWQRVSVFPGSFDLAAAEAVCGFGVVDADDVLDLVTALVDKSVLTRADVDDVARFRMLETLREYGQERLVDERGEDELLARHRAHYAELVATMDREVDEAVARRSDWYRRLDPELPHLRLLVDPPGAGALPPESIVSIYRLTVFWRTRGLVSEALRHVRRALAEDDASPTYDRLEALDSAATLADAQGDTEQHAAWVAELLAGAERCPDPRAEALALSQQSSWLARTQGRTDGVEALEAAAAIFAEHGEVRLLFQTLQELMLIHVYARDLDRAEAVLAEGLALVEVRPSLRAGVLNGPWGVALTSAGRYDEAVGLLLGAIREAIGEGDVVDTADLLDALALALHGERRTEVALLCLGASRRLLAQTGVPAGLEAMFAEEWPAFERDARALLGDEGYDAALERGASLQVEEVVALVEGGAEAPPTASGPSELLTPRELEVAELVAAGLTNRLVAERLFITPRTVRGHIENILIKLGLESRVQVAAWFVARDRGLSARAAGRRADPS